MSDPAAQARADQLQAEILDARAAKHVAGAMNDGEAYDAAKARVAAARKELRVLVLSGQAVAQSPYEPRSNPAEPR